MRNVHCSCCILVLQICAIQKKKKQKKYKIFENQPKKNKCNFLSVLKNCLHMRALSFNHLSKSSSIVRVCAFFSCGCSSIYLILALLLIL